jgi:hypothetical protein
MAIVSDTASVCFPPERTCDFDPKLDIRHKGLPSSKKAVSKVVSLDGLNSIECVGLASSV